MTWNLCSHFEIFLFFFENFISIWKYMFGSSISIFFFENLFLILKIFIFWKPPYLYLTLHINFYFSIWNFLIWNTLKLVLQLKTCSGGRPEARSYLGGHWREVHFSGAQTPPTKTSHRLICSTVRVFVLFIHPYNHTLAVFHTLQTILSPSTVLFL